MVFTNRNNGILRQNLEDTEKVQQIQHMTNKMDNDKEKFVFIFKDLCRQ